MVKVIADLHWGDTGKGKIIDWLVEEEKPDIVARYQGGANAGHTVQIGGEKFILHLIPSGILHPDIICVLGNGMVVNPIAFFDEIEGLKKKGIEIEGRLFVSDRCHVTLDYHILEERCFEEARGKDRIDTTLRGVGPTYHDKAGRIGIRMCDFIDEGTLRPLLEANLEEKNWLFRHRYGKEGLDKGEVIDKHLDLASKMEPLVRDISVFLNDAIRSGKNIICEGAQGTLLDIDHGTYPYVTCSNPTAGGACTGLGIGPTKIDQVIGIAKAYTTRVGAGPFPTRLPPDIEERMRKRGQEYGTTTGRARKCGWFDAVAVRYAVRVNGVDSLAITKLDVLDEFETLYICTGYKYKGRIIKDFPAQVRILEEVEPIYEDLPGWRESSQGIRRIRDFPRQTRAYLDRISELAETKISLVSVGPERNQIAV